jgi:hypothetical protein
VVSGEAAQIDPSPRHAEVESDRERLHVPCNGCGDGTAAFLFQDAELAVAGGRLAWSPIRLLISRERQ